MNGRRGAGEIDMEALIGSVLLIGVIVSLTLTAAGIAWHWAQTGVLGLDYPLLGMNVFQFLFHSVADLFSSAFGPSALMNLGIATLLFTPYLRVVASMLFFALVERNWKYTGFTGFVFAVLTYTMLLR